MTREQSGQTKARCNFIRLAETRTNRVLKDLELLSNLANKTNYSYDENDVKKIVAAIKSKVKEVENRFDANLATSKTTKFTLIE